MINDEVDNTAKYIYLTVIIDITRKITEFVNFLMSKSHHFVMSYLRYINTHIILKFQPSIT